jgi:isopentenyl-diphosphate Delta-isomerase
MGKNPTASRKAEHIRINLEEDVQSDLSNGLERYHFLHQALPEIDLDQVDTRVTVFGKLLRMPLLISSMTGGTEEAGKINRVLAQAAQARGIALGLGSQRAAIEDPTLEETFKVRKEAPDVLLFANLGAIQLNYAYSVEQCKRAVEMVEADALFLHLNPLQEALQPEGDTHFAGLIRKIEQVCHSLTVPVVVKEVGWGISGKAARMLMEAGVSAIDVAGAGGTSWSQVEMYRSQDPHKRKIASDFRGWGIPTADALVQVKQATPDLPIFASGGLRNGIELAKCISLGATLTGMAGPFLRAAAQSYGAVTQLIDEFNTELRICMFSAGAPSVGDLAKIPLIKRHDA